MGIKGLTQLIGDCAPSAIKENEIKNYFGMLCLFNYSEIFQYFILTYCNLLIQVER